MAQSESSLHGDPRRSSTFHRPLYDGLTMGGTHSIATMFILDPKTLDLNGTRLILIGAKPKARQLLAMRISYTYRVDIGQDNL